MTFTIGVIKFEATQPKPTSASWMIFLLHFQISEASFEWIYPYFVKKFARNCLAQLAILHFLPHNFPFLSNDESSNRIVSCLVRPSFPAT